jgi:uncharacterized membrane protein YedE/YeeE
VSDGTGLSPGTDPSARPPSRTPRHPLAVPGFVVALAGVVLAIVPLTDMVPWLVCPAGLVLSVVALCSSRPDRTLAWWGAGLAVVGLAICALWAVIIASTEPRDAVDSPTYQASGSAAVTGRAGGPGRWSR